MERVLMAKAARMARPLRTMESPCSSRYLRTHIVKSVAKMSLIVVPGNLALRSLTSWSGMCPVVAMHLCVPGLRWLGSFKRLGGSAGRSVPMTPRMHPSRKIAPEIIVEKFCLIDDMLPFGFIEPAA